MPSVLHRVGAVQCGIALISVARQMVKRLVAEVGPRSSEKRAQVAARPMTARQHEIVEHIATGLTNKEIATRLSISVSGVKKHLEALFRRYRVSGRAALVHAVMQSRQQ